MAEIINCLKKEGGRIYRDFSPKRKGHNVAYVRCPNWIPPQIKREVENCIGCTHSEFVLGICHCSYLKGCINPEHLGKVNCDGGFEKRPPK